MPALDPLQKQVRQSSARFKVLPWGRRCGKSRLLQALALEAVLEPQHGGPGTVWWIWPSRTVGRPGWTKMRPLGRQLEQQIRGVRVFEVERVISFPNGGELQMKTADDPATLVGEGLTRAIFDECGLIPVRAWDESVSPTLLDQAGDAVFGGVPKGQWGLLWYAHQQAHAAPGWQEWKRTTLQSPWIRQSEKDRIRGDYAAGRVPERIWRQEVLGEFVSDAGAVFRGIAEAATAEEQTAAIPGHQYVIGVDWGKAHDFTVFAVWDLNLSALILLDRSNLVDYALQRKRLEALCNRFKPLEVIAEQNAMGEPIIEELQRVGLPVRPFVTSSASKAAAVEGLALAIENGTAKIIPDETLMLELQAYERGVSGQLGRPTYGAPAGSHDDTVMAACIGWTGVQSGAILDVEWA